jgi:pimeloyl-ACP methyl ester carboxylesterase
LINDVLLAPALDVGAQDVFLAVYSAPAGPTRESLLKRIRENAEDTGTEIPILALWGEDDGFTPYDEGAQALREMVTSLKVIPHAGHCLHDEHPELVNDKTIKFLNKYAVISGVENPLSP